MIMQMMAQLTQGHAQLNQAMTEAMNQQLQINRNVEWSVEYKDRSELKGIPKPDKFTGASGTWDSWWYKFKTWVESCHKNAVKIVAQVESQCDKEITESGLEVDFDEGAELVSAQARQALISLTEGEALEIVKNTSRGSHFGLEAMRRLLCKYDAQNPQATSALLKKVLHPSQCSLDKLREGLESWENLKRKYEDRRKKPLEDDICRSCLQQMCPNKQDHLDLQASRLTTYDQVKAEVLAYLENVETRKEAKSGAVPMDVDSLAKGKGKGKHDKGKGKGKSKGKDKGKSQSSSWSNNSYNKGSWNNQSWNQQSWYKQNTNDSKSKGKGKKGQDKGKGKGDQSKGCKVANVESDAWAQEQPAATATGDQPEPELTALFTLEDTMAPKSERPEESEPRRGRSPRQANLQPKSKETVTRGALMMAQQALVSASGSNEELYGQMISQAEKAVKEAEDKGLAANQAFLERQEALNKLKEEAAQKKKEVKEEMARVRAESRAASAPASASRRLKAKNPWNG